MDERSKELKISIASKHLDLWEKAMRKALRRGELYAAQVAERQIDEYREILFNLEEEGDEEEDE